MRATAIEFGKVCNISQLHNDAADLIPTGTCIFKRFAGGCKRFIALRRKISAAAAAAHDNAAM